MFSSNFTQLFLCCWLSGLDFRQVDLGSILSLNTCLIWIRIQLIEEEDDDEEAEEEEDEAEEAEEEEEGENPKRSRNGEAGGAGESIKLKL